MKASDKPITSFRGEYDWLSNFFDVAVRLENKWYNTIENAYQAGKTWKTEIREQIAEMTPGQAKRFGKTIALRDGWEQIKLPLMSTLVRQKFEISDWRVLLIDTKDAHIIEGNTWGDKFWGAVWDSEKEQWDGSNHLGNLIMNIRARILNEK